MSDVTLTDINIPDIDTRYPSVFIEKIEIDYDNYATPGGFNDSESDARIVAYINIKFTKKPHIQYKTIKSYITSEFNDLYLYAELTYPTHLKQELETNTFNIYEWRKYRQSWIRKSWRDSNTFEVSLQQLLDKATYQSEVVLKSTFDSTGNEIVEISNIKLPFFADGFGTRDEAWESALEADDSFSPHVADIPNLMFIAYVGHKDVEIQKNRYFNWKSKYAQYADDKEFSDEKAFKTKHYSKSQNTYNSFYGNITYYHVLEYNKVPSQFYQVYTLQSGQAYYGEVIQSNNGKFYSTDFYTFEDIINTFNGAIFAYSAARKTDAALDRNLKGLELILNTNEDRTMMINKLVSYQATYTGKQQNTESGRFYNDFVMVFADVLQNIATQPQLTVRMLFDSLVHDKRAELLVGTYNTNPRFDPQTGTYTDETFKAGRENVFQQQGYDYLPDHWFEHSRKGIIRNTSVGSESGQISSEELEKIYGNASSYLEEAGSFAEGGDYANLRDSFIESYIEQGYTPDQAEELAEDELAYALTEGELGTRLSLLNPNSEMGSLAGMEFVSGDIVVRNRGHFFFEWEKAARNQSYIGMALDVEKAQKYFRLNIPYDQYYISSCELRRDELELDPEADTGTYEGIIGVVNLMTNEVPTRVLKLKNPAAAPGYPAEGSDDYVDYPKTKKSELSYDLAESNLATGRGHLGVGFSHSNMVLKLKYGRPATFVGTTKYCPYLKMIHFDMPTMDLTQRLSGWNNIDNMSSWDEIKGSVADGYRIAAFEFADFMDDDVAYYNTNGLHEFEDGGDRPENLTKTNNLAHPGTCYKVRVTCQDQTYITYENFTNECAEVYNRFAEYASEAAEVCSNNNITNAYNDFFIDAIKEKYPDRPWILAAYYAVGLSDIIFGSFGSPLDESTFRQRVVRNTLGIAPESGNLPATELFLAQFNALIGCLRPSVFESMNTSVSLPSTGVTPHSVITNAQLVSAADPESRHFYQQYPIVADIFGSVVPDLEPTNSFDIRDVAPMPVVSLTTTTPPSGHDWVEVREVQAIRYAFEQVFYTEYLDDVHRALRPTTAPGPVAGAYGGMWEDSSGPRYASMVGTRMEADTYSGIEEAGHTFSNLSLICNRILKVSTIDTKLTQEDGMYQPIKGKRRAANGWVDSRRSFRTLYQLKHLVEQYYIPEADRRLALRVCKFWSDGVLRSERFAELATINLVWLSWSSAEKSMWSYKVPPDDFYEEEGRRRHIEHIRYALHYIKNYLNWQLGLTSSPGFKGPGTSGVPAPHPSGDKPAGWYDAAEDYFSDMPPDPARLLEIVREEDPKGSDSFNSAVSTSEYI